MTKYILKDYFTLINPHGELVTISKYEGDLKRIISDAMLTGGWTVKNLADIFGV